MNQNVSAASLAIIKKMQQSELTESHRELPYMYDFFPARCTVHVCLCV